MRAWLAVALCALAAASAGAREPAPFAAAVPAMGSSWYPEQWPEARWDADLALMERAHLNVVRVGEFAWARMEPRDGAFDFGWLDRAIDAAARHRIRVVIGTPTAAPPIWLTEAHPDVLRVDAHGSVAGHGARRQFSYASATYRRYASRIAGELAKRFGHNPNVVGWQIDNEIGVPSYDREANARWAAWLATRYDTIDALNRRWTTQYWSQVYTRFDQVPLTLAAEQNPALVLDARRFASAEWADYIGDQAAAIRAHADPRQFVTTNSTQWNDNFDQYAVHHDLNIAAWDEYVPDGHPDWPANALHHAVVRGYRQRNFWIMETQPGRVDWGRVNRSLDPGQTRELAWQAVAHGADAILYWQWRSALNGQEQYHGTLIGPDGTPMPIYDEIARTADEMRRAAPYLAGTTPAPAEVALIYSQDSRWSIEQERHTRDYDPVAVMKDWYRPFHAAGIRVDVVAPNADLSRYRLVLAPQLTVLDAAIAHRLEAYVKAGGHLLLGPRSGMKDGDNALAARQPGDLTGLLGARVEYYYPIDAPVTLSGNGFSATAHVWAETLDTISGATIIARYRPNSGWLSDKPAFVMKSAGRGWIAYLGALLDSKGQAAVTTWARAQATLAGPVVPAQANLEIVERRRGTSRYLIAINHRDTDLQPAFPAGFTKVVAGMSGKTLPAHGVLVLTFNDAR
ncbi:beta-galactosidase [Sphingomonas sp.]|uniref:beta-galactosidase n=1 Tax=Sphingomonas sp. TaxID=28214 RepID=UPI0035C8217A